MLVCSLYPYDAGLKFTFNIIQWVSFKYKSLFKPKLLNSASYIDRNSRPEVLCKKGVPRNFAKFTKNTTGGCFCIEEDFDFYTSLHFKKQRLHFKKQPLAYVLQNECSQNFFEWNTSMETSVLKPIFDKLADPRPATSGDFWNDGEMVIFVNFAKILTRPLLGNTSGRRLMPFKSPLKYQGLKTKDLYPQEEPFTQHKKWSFWLRMYRNSHRVCSVRKCVVRNFAQFIGKHLCKRLFLGLSLQLYLKTVSGTGVFLWILRNF